MYLKSLILTLEMDREIDYDKHFITPGGYYMTDKNGREYAFDFFNTSGMKWSKNPFRIEYTCDGLDLDAFPNGNEIGNHLDSIVSFPECYVWTGEDGDPEINVKKVLSCTLEFAGEGKAPKLKNTPYFHFQIHQGKNEFTLLAICTKKLLNTIESFPNG